MKNTQPVSRSAIPLLLIAILLFPGCAVVGGIFKTGMGVGIFLTLLVIVLIIFLILRMRKK
jgi:hypothetical protein